MRIELSREELIEAVRTYVFRKTASVATNHLEVVFKTDPKAYVDGAYLELEVPEGQ